MKLKKWVRMTFSLPIEVEKLLRQESQDTDKKMSIIVARAITKFIINEK